MNKEKCYKVESTDLYLVELENTGIAIRVLAGDAVQLYKEDIPIILKHEISKNGLPPGFDKDHHYFYVTREPSPLGENSYYYKFEPVMVVPFTAPTAKTPAVKKKSKPTKQHNRTYIKEGI